MFTLITALSEADSGGDMGWPAAFALVALFAAVAVMVWAVTRR